MNALEIIKNNGIFSLWDCQGTCPCGDFYVAGIKVEFDCWRTARLQEGQVGSLMNSKSKS